MERPTSGDASESALIKFFEPIEHIEDIRNRYQVAQDPEGKPAKLAFNSTNKYAFLIIEYETPDSHYCLMSKGAPEKIWSLCENVYDKGEISKKNEEWESEFEKVN